MDWSNEIAALSNAEERDLATQAALASEHADAEYSEFSVGAALRTTDGYVFTAANVENGSFGLTSCAERNAIFRAVAEKGPGVRFDLIALVAISDRIDLSKPPPPTISPCGACRQVLERFKADDDAKVVFVRDGGFVSMTIRELFPVPSSSRIPIEPPPSRQPNDRVAVELTSSGSLPGIAAVA